MTTCRACMRIASGFILSGFSQCRKCRESVIGKDNRQCRICGKIDEGSKFHGSVHVKCKYLRDKRIAAGGVLTTTKGELR